MQATELKQPLKPFDGGRKRTGAKRPYNAQADATTLSCEKKGVGVSKGKGRTLNGFVLFAPAVSVGHNSRIRGGACRQALLSMVETQVLDIYKHLVN